MRYPFTAKGLRTFPPEIRQIIFEKAMHWDGHAPALLQALRSEVLQIIPELYYDALKVLFKQSMYCLSQRNNWGFGDMSEKAIRAVKHLKIKLG